MREANVPLSAVLVSGWNVSPLLGVKPPIKWIVAGMLTSLVTAYLATAGRTIARKRKPKVVAQERGLWSAPAK